LNAHLGKQLSRKDDLITVLYLLVWFTKDSLPWTKDLFSLKKDVTEVLAETAEKKAKCGLIELC